MTNATELTTEEIVRALREVVSDPMFRIHEIAKRCRIAADRLESQEATIAGLTARAESAERERDAAIKDIEELMKFTVYSTASCKFCKKKHTGCRDGCIKPKWRGLQPQDGWK